MTHMGNLIYAEENDDGSACISVEIPDEIVQRYEFRVDDDGLAVERYGSEPGKCLGEKYLSWADILRMTGGTP